MQHVEDKIQELFKRQEKLFAEFDNFKLQHQRFISDMESEKGTIARAHKNIYEELEKYFKLIYNQDNGIAFELDRLKQKEKRRADQNKWLWGIVASIGAALVTLIVNASKKT